MNERVLNFTSRDQVSSFIDLLRKEGSDVFCHSDISKNGVILPEDEWAFHYSNVSYCEKCRKTRRILEKNFGSTKNFNRLPPVLHLGNEFFFVHFSLMKEFSLNDRSHNFFLREKKRRYQQWLEK